MRAQWVPYPVERTVATAAPFAPVGEKGTHEYLAAGRWWDRPASVMFNCLRGFVGNDRFAVGGEQVIKRTSSGTKKAARALVVAEQGRL